MSSLAISSGGRPLEQRSCSTIAPSSIDAAHGPRIRTSRRAATGNATKPCSSFNRPLSLLSGVWCHKPLADASGWMLPLLRSLSWWRGRRTRCDEIAERW